VNPSRHMCAVLMTVDALSFFSSQDYRPSQKHCHRHSRCFASLSHGFHFLTGLSVVPLQTAVASGDLGVKVHIEAAGEIAALCKTINDMIDRLSIFAAEVTRVAREVGTKGELVVMTFQMDVSSFSSISNG